MMCKWHSIKYLLKINLTFELYFAKRPTKQVTEAEELDMSQNCDRLVAKGVIKVSSPRTVPTSDAVLCIAYILIYWYIRKIIYIQLLIIYSQVQAFECEGDYSYCSTQCCLAKVCFVIQHCTESSIWSNTVHKICCETRCGQRMLRNY